MEIPEAAIEAAVSRHPEWSSLQDAVRIGKARSACLRKMEELRGKARADLQAALPALREHLACEVLESLNRELATASAEDRSNYRDGVITGLGRSIDFIEGKRDAQD